MSANIYVYTSNTGNNILSIDSNYVYVSQNLTVNGLMIGNISISQTSISIGNLVINSNSAFLTTNLSTFVLQNTIPTLTVNNTLYFEGNPAGFFANVTSPYISNNINVGSNVILSTTGLTVNGTSNVVVNSSGIFIGNSTANISLTSSYMFGSYLTSNNTLYLGGLAANNYANTSQVTFSQSINVGSNISINTGSISVNNIIINSSGMFFGQTSVNSSFYSGTANNTLYFEGNPLGFFANVTSPYISGNLAVGPYSNGVFINTSSIKIGNSSVYSVLNSSSISIGNLTVTEMDGGVF